MGVPISVLMLIFIYPREHSKILEVMPYDDQAEAHVKKIGTVITGKLI